MSSKIIYECNECGEQFEIFRQLAKHKRAALCRGEEIEDIPAPAAPRVEPQQEVDADNASAEPQPEVETDNAPAVAKKKPGRKSMGIGAHMCPVCDQRMQYKSQLKQHMVVHTRERPFACDDCGMAYAFKQPLENHRLKRHGKAPLHKQAPGRPAKVVQASTVVRRRWGKISLHCPKCNRIIGGVVALIRNKNGMKSFRCKCGQGSYLAPSQLN